jgi:hypothetical protein
MIFKSKIIWKLRLLELIFQRIKLVFSQYKACFSALNLLQKESKL